MRIEKLFMLVTLLFAGAGAIAQTPKTSAPPIFGVNLIVNGDAESGPGSTDGSTPSSIPGWTTTNGFAAVQYGASGGFPAATDPGPTNRGLNFFSGGPTAGSASATQSIDTSSAISVIDAGKVLFTLSGYLGGFSSQGDNAVLTITFLNSNETSLGSAVIGPVSAADRNNLTGLLFRSTSGIVPVGTTQIGVSLVMTRLEGSYNDGYADNLSLSLTASAPKVSQGGQIDFFGEGRADYTVWRPSTGYWYSIDNSGKSLTAAWGESTDLPVIGDFDGDGKSDLAVFRPSNGTWYITDSSNKAVVAKPWGASGDLPVAGDFDGDGKTDFAVFRSSNGTWYISQSSNGAAVTRQWGASTDIPVVGDFDGDGKSDIAVFRPSNGTWYISQSSTGTAATHVWGASGDIPVSGDFDGDGKTDLAVFRPSNGTWYISLSSTGKAVTQVWGQSGDVPVARDYDGDGKTDIAVWRSSTGSWYVIDSSTGETTTVPWGAAKDIPINGLSR